MLGAGGRTGFVVGFRIWLGLGLVTRLGLRMIMSIVGMLEC